MAKQHSRLAVSLLQGVRRVTSRILLYHGIGEAGRPDDPHHLLVEPSSFRHQIELLRSAAFQFVTVSELVAMAPQGGRPPAGYAAISFDDGMEDNFSTALPIMQELGVRGTIYVQTGVIGEENPWVAGERMMNRRELSAVANAGFELGAHTVTHPDLSSMSYEACLAEMTESRDVVAELSGRPVSTFAYPFGHYGPDAMKAAADAGFEAAATCVNRGSWDRFELKRTLVTGRDGVASFVARVCGIYEPLVLGRSGTFARRATSGLRQGLRERRGS
jgi:peptidoglycan/xylan/chitin deacetylase (PgdA/CDA1 family)